MSNWHAEMQDKEALTSMELFVGLVLLLNLVQAFGGQQKPAALLRARVGDAS